MADSRQKLALVVGSVPTVDEIDQFQLIREQYDVNVIASESVCSYLQGCSFFQDLTCLALPDYDDNPSYLPGLERVLAGYDIVILKERLGLYAYQTVKAKWQHKFRLAVWIDNLTVYPAQDLDQTRIIRDEVMRGADLFIVQSKAARETLLIEGIEEDRIQYMIPWIAVRAQRTPASRCQALAALKLSESHLLVSFMGQVEWEEGLNDLLVGCKLAIKSDASLERRLRLAICGVGSYTNELSELAAKLELADRIMYVNPGRAEQMALLEASDAVYIAPGPSRDRIDGDPYRILGAMAGRIPMLATRTPIVEEYCGKHRLDICAKSPESIADTLIKLAGAKSLCKDIVNQNQKVVQSKFNDKAAAAQMLFICKTIASAPINNVVTSIENQVLDVETKVRNKQFVAAVDAIEAILQQPGVPVHHHANLNRLIGDCFLKLSDAESAKEAYIKAVNLDPYAHKTHIGLGTLSLIKEHFGVAVPHFQKAVGLAPSDEMASLGLGLAFEGLGELREALRWIAKSIELNDENMPAIFSLVKVSHKLDRYEAAEQVLRSYVARHPHDANILFTLGGIYFKQGKVAATIEMMERILKANPADSRAAVLLDQARAADKQAGIASNKG